MKNNLKPQIIVTGQEQLLAADNIGVSSNGRWLIRNLDLEIARGEIVTLVGPNGGGKTTSLRAILGLVPLNEGQITRSGSLTIGYVPQKTAIEPTVPLNVRRFMRLTHRLSETELTDALMRTGVKSIVNSPMHDLSGGEFQRVQLARAIAKCPDLLVLDEPAQGVDFHGELAMYELIAAIRDELNCGILLVSHDLHIVMAKSDRVLCLNGHVCCQGSPSDVRENQAYAEMFGTEGSGVVGLYHHHHDHSHDLHDHHIPNKDHKADE